MAVLVVDDDENILHTLTLLLKSEGMECFACRSPQEALAALRKTSSQLALVDLNYVEDTTSGREGLALITALRQMDEELPIVAMTGWGQERDKQAALRAGFDMHLTKPADPAVLETLLSDPKRLPSA